MGFKNSFLALLDSFLKHLGFFSKNVSGIPVTEQRQCGKIDMLAVKLPACGYCFDLILCENTLL